MLSAPANPLLKPLSLFLVGLSLSVGWGIRGQFGHESGAWIPGALAAIAVCLLSQREDWQHRVAYCALFGGLGWGFGGSISYMYTLAFASSGQWQTVWYGYFAVFLVGGLWAGLGGAGMALPLSLDRDRLTRLFVPLCFVLAAMIANHFLYSPLSDFLKTSDAVAADGTWGRHKSPLYWLDSDWLAALWAVLGVCLYDLWDRRFSGGLQLLLSAAGGMLAGYLLQLALNLTGTSSLVASVLSVPMGDPTAISPETHQPFDPQNLMTNWPQFFSDFPQHLGWAIGLVLGVAIYFYRYGKWNNDSKLFLYMSLGWLLAFFIMPVLGTIPLARFGGFRLTPPRSDDWAGITGVFIGTCAYALRHQMAPVAYAAVCNFILGGTSFASMHFFRQMLIIPGHPALNWQTGGTPAAWQHFQSANWHSILEQLQGFGFGITMAVTMGLLWPRSKPTVDEPRLRRWTEVFSIGFVVCFMTWVNLVKNVAEWTGKEHPVVPPAMKAPLIPGIELNAGIWFNLAWCAMSFAFVGLMIVHQRKRLEIVPSSWIGKGQLIYVLLLWIMAIGNFERLLPGFSEGRLITEWVIIINASLATFLAIVLPANGQAVVTHEPVDYRSLTRRAGIAGLSCAALLLTLYAGVVSRVYGPVQNKISGAQLRFGDNAAWRVKPILKNKEHR
jgi:hypothetical protein